MRDCALNRLAKCNAPTARGRETALAPTQWTTESRVRRRKRITGRPSAALCALMLLAAISCMLPAAAYAQTLARRGWAGSGLDMAPWWKSAVFYQVDPDSMQSSVDAGKTSFAALADRLDYLKSLNVDALVLTPFSLAPPEAQTAQTSAANSALQTEADFDTLLAEAGRRHMRILIDLHVTQQTSATTLALARFWMGRGVAGLRLGLTRKQASANNFSPGDVVDLVKRLRVLCATYPGDRVLLWDSDETFAALENAATQQAATQQAAKEQAFAVQSASRRVHPGRTSGRTYRSRRGGLSRNRFLRGSDGPQLEVEHALEQLPSLDASDLRATLLSKSPHELAAAPLTVSVTDSEGAMRSFSRYKFAQASDAMPLDAERSSAISTARAKLLAAVLLTGPSLPMIFFGQEIGVRQPGSDRKVSVAIPPAPAPLPQPSVPTDTAPPMPQPSAHPDAADDADANSLLNFYRRLSSLRHANAAFQNGSFRVLTTNQTGIVAWVRVARGSGARQAAVVVVCNVSDNAETVGIEAALRDAGVPANPSSTLATPAESGLANLASGASEPAAAIALEPYGVFIGQLRATVGSKNFVPTRRRSRHRQR